MFADIVLQPRLYWSGNPEGFNDTDIGLQPRKPRGTQYLQTLFHSLGHTSQETPEYSMYNETVPQPWLY